jgi:hypothetical protein
MERKDNGSRGGEEGVREAWRSAVAERSHGDARDFFIYDDRRGAEVANRIPCGATDGRLIPSITVRAKASNRWSKVSSKL